MSARYYDDLGKLVYNSIDDDHFKIAHASTLRVVSRDAAVWSLGFQDNAIHVGSRSASEDEKEVLDFTGNSNGAFVVSALTAKVPLHKSFEAELKFEEKGWKAKFVQKLGKNVSITSTTDDRDAVKVAVDTTLVHANALLGGQVVVDSALGRGGSWQLSDYNFGGQLERGNETLTFKTLEKTDLLTAGVALVKTKLFDSLAFIGNYHFKDSSKRNITVGATKKLDNNNFVQGKLANTGVLSTSYTHQVNSFAEITLNAELNLISKNKPSFGINFVFGDL